MFRKSVFIANEGEEDQEGKSQWDLIAEQCDGKNFSPRKLRKRVRTLSLENISPRTEDEEGSLLEAERDFSFCEEENECDES